MKTYWGENVVQIDGNDVKVENIHIESDRMINYWYRDLTGNFSEETSLETKKYYLAQRTDKIFALSAVSEQSSGVKINDLIWYHLPINNILGITQDYSRLFDSDFNLFFENWNKKNFLFSINKNAWCYASFA